MRPTHILMLVAGLLLPRTPLPAEILLPPPVEAEPSVLDLPRAMNLALSQNPDFLAGFYETRKLQETRNQAGAALLPRVVAQYAFEQIDDNRPEVLSGQDPSSQGRFGLRLEQRVFDDEAITAWRAGTREFKASHQAQDARALDLMRDVGMAYYDWLEQESAARILDSWSRDLATLAREDGPDVTRWALLRARVLEQSLQAQSSRAVLLEQLNGLMNVAIDQAWDPPVMPEADFPFLLEAENLVIRSEDDWRMFRRYLHDRALENRAELRFIELKLEAGRLRRHAAQRGYFSPKVSAQVRADREVSAEYASGFDETVDEDEWSFRLLAEFPLFQGGGQMSLHDERLAEVNRLLRERDALNIRIHLEVRQAVHRIQASLPNASIYAKAARTGAGLFQKTVEGYRQGQRGLADAVDAMEAQLHAELADVHYRHQKHRDVIQLQRAIGWFEFTKTLEERNAFVAGFELLRAPSDPEPVFPAGE